MEHYSRQSPQFGATLPASQNDATIMTLRDTANTGTSSSHRQGNEVMMMTVSAALAALSVPADVTADDIHDNGHLVGSVGHGDMSRRHNRLI